MLGMWWLLRVKRDNRKMYSNDVERILVVGVLRGEVPTFQLLAIRIVKYDVTDDHIWIMGHFNPLFK